MRKIVIVFISLMIFVPVSYAQGDFECDTERFLHLVSTFDEQWQSVKTYAEENQLFYGILTLGIFDYSLGLITAECRGDILSSQGESERMFETKPETYYAITLISPNSEPATATIDWCGDVIEMNTEQDAPTLEMLYANDVCAVSVSVTGNDWSMLIEPYSNFILLGSGLK